MTTAASRLAEPGHRLTRKGRELQVHVVQIPDDIDGGHALVFSEISDGRMRITDNCLVRIHSRCLYGDALQSDDCDCGPELDMAMDRIWAQRTGILFYLEQEGRGAGLINKARGLETSERFDLDTFDSYAQLQLIADSRSYKLAADTLVGLGLTSVRLLTNNPDKVRALETAGLKVSVVPLHTRPRSERARKYLEAKRRRRGHMIPPADIPSVPEVHPVFNRKSRIWRIITLRGPVRRARRHAAQPALPASK